MAASHVPTTTITNLTRLELEALRRADASTLGRAVTKGDDGTIIGGVGVGSVFREPFTSGPVVHLDDIFALPPPGAPGGGLGTTTQTSSAPSETVQWFGPTYIFDGTAAQAGTTTSITDFSIGLDFAAAGVLAGDFVLLKPSVASGANSYAVATVATTPLGGATTLSLNNILTSVGGTALSVDGQSYPYVIVRKSACRLFAMPGSGTFNAEQAFIFVQPASTLHTTANPTLVQIETDRVRNIVPPQYNASTVDRADSIFAATPTALDKLGYRVVFYPDNGSGAPDYSKPILTTTPRINTTLPFSEQRMTIDHRAGILRLSCAPNNGSDINPAGVYSPLGRVNLWAMFWSFDQSITGGAARGLFAQRSDETTLRAPGRVVYDAGVPGWRIGSTSNINEFYVKALDVSEDPLVGTEFGTFDTGSLRPRYFRYETGQNVWRMRATGDALDIGNKYGEVELGGRTKLTVGDGSAPKQAPGDYNPTVQLGTTSAMGFRNVQDPIRSAITASFNGAYATVHLRKGRYYTDDVIHVAPGITVEGEGPATRVFARSDSGADTKSLFKVGPNTAWGVYDPTWDGSSVVPTQFSFASSTKIEGYDIVWNPTRRVWGIVQADVSTNAIWFNEVKVDGTLVLPGLGIDIKNDARLLYSSTSPGAENHTPAHYPRIAYHEAQDEYAVVWVEKEPSLSGPICKVQIVDVTSNDPIAFTTRFTTATQAALGVFSGSTFSDHPSIAVDNSNASANYTVAISYWGFNATLSTSMTCATIRSASSLSNIETANEAEAAKNVASSTDVAEDNYGGYLWTWSVRNHPIYTGTDGAVTTTVTPGDTFADPTFTGVTTFTAANVEAGDRFLYLGATGRPGGADGVVQVVTGTTLTVAADDLATPFQLTAGTPITWALVPRTTVFTKRFYAGGTIGSKQNVLFANPAASTYRLEVREPDFVRLSRGGDAWLLAYQAFDTTAFLSQDLVKNFDNGRDTSLIDNAGFTLKDRNPYREHIATCAAVLGDYGGIAFPMAGDDILTTGGFDEHAARDLNVSTRSLGGRDPLLVSPNGSFGMSPQRLISARNFFHKWTASECMSLIPDATWTGQDWVVVSPSKNEIRSSTGKVTVAGGPTYYLSDASFYFGEDGTMANGAYLRRTITPGTDQVYIASLNFLFNVTAIVTEHTIQITPVSGAPGATTDGVEWVLIRPQSLGVAAGIKNPGFRVSAEGRLISSTTYTTFADEATEGSSTPRRTELMVRKTTTSDGLNTPATLIVGYNDPAFSQAAIWGDVSFRGVAVGAPKGMASNNDVLKESPTVAISWGETMYGFLDREVRGSATILNRTNFFRQSFGPYRVGFRNIALMGGNNASSGVSPLKQLSQEHVLTRHGNPATSAGGFATDGFRNCFVAPIVTAFDESESLTNIRYPSATQAYYTDARGSNALAMRGPATLEIPEYGLGTDYMSDLLASLPNPAGAPTNDLVMARSRPSSPQVLWDGSRFVAAWTETNSAPAASTDQNRYGVICLGAFPGGEDQFAQDRILTGDSDFLTKITEFAVVSVGNVNEDAVPARSVFAASLAYSGRTYAVLWTGGMNPSTATDLGGSAIGVVIFNGTGAFSSGNNFVIDTNDKRGHYQDGKILWDGKQFVAVWRQNNNGTGAGELYYSIIPETGFGTHSQLIASAGKSSAAGPTPVLGIGTVVGSVLPIGGAEAVIDISANPTPVKPGDLVHIDHIVLFAGGDDTTYSGWWIVKDYDPSTSSIRLHYDGAPVPWTGLAAATHTVVGAIFSMSQGSEASLQNIGGNPNQPVTGTLYRPQRLGINPFSNPAQLLTDFDRLDGFVYNEVDDEYAVLLRKTAGTLGITTWKRGTFQAAPEKAFTLAAACSAASLAWNGRSYLVAYNASTTDNVLYSLLSPRLSVEATGTVATKSTTIGNGANQVPGPGYGTVRSSSLVQPRLTNLVTAWNNRLNRWVISGAWLWYQEVTGATLDTQINAVQMPLSPATLDVQSYVGRAVTWQPGFADIPQVGCRLIGVRSGASSIEHVFSPTVKSISGPGVVTLDTHLSELSGDATANWGVPPYGASPTPGLAIGVVCREDIVCWTLGYAAPAVQLVDADDVSFEGVEFSGGYVDVEERYVNLARPTFQNGGLSFGKPSADRLKPNHVNHVLMTPASKTKIASFTNVRSLTRARHGQGASPALPAYDRSR